MINDVSDEDKDTLLRSFSNFFDIYNSIIGKSYYLENANNPHLICTSDSISIVKLNTAWLDDNSSNNNDFLRVGTRHLQVALSEVSDVLESTINIAIGHHTLEDMLPEERIRILNEFDRNNIGIYFCGHQHKPNIKYYSEYDVLEFVAPGGYNDGYSNGGYIWGIIDTDIDFYKAEIYGWYDNKWCIESRLSETDDHGIYYFNTNKFKNHSQIAAIDCKTIGGHIPIRDLEKSLNSSNFDVHVYSGPIGDINGYTQESIEDFSQNIIRLVEKNDKVHLYPLAPIPMLISLGFELQKNSNITIHQFDRKTQSWVSSGQSWGAILEEPILEKNGSKTIVISISTSYNVEKEQINKVMGDSLYDYIGFKTDKIEAGYPLCFEDVDNIVEKIITIMDLNINKYNNIHLFAAIPAGMAVELGRRMLKTVYSNIHTYQLDNGVYKHALLINPRTLQQPIFNNNSNAIFIDKYNHNVCDLKIWGNIACGQKNAGDTNNDLCFPVLESILGNGEFFVVQAKGDSMINVGINEGDYVIIKKQSFASNKDIVVALIDGETTLKTLYRDDKKKTVILHPENEAYDDIEYNELEIQGIAVHVIKKL